MTLDSLRKLLCICDMNQNLMLWTRADPEIFVRRSKSNRQKIDVLFIQSTYFTEEVQLLIPRETNFSKGGGGGCMGGMGGMGPSFSRRDPYAYSYIAHVIFQGGGGGLRTPCPPPLWICSWWVFDDHHSQMFPLRNKTNIIILVLYTVHKK